MTKTATFRVRCTTVEYEALEVIAQHEAIKPSEALRQVVREAAQRRGLWPPARVEPLHAKPVAPLAARPVER